MYPLDLFLGDAAQPAIQGTLDQDVKQWCSTAFKFKMSNGPFSNYTHDCPRAAGRSLFSTEWEGSDKRPYIIDERVFGKA